MEGRNVTGVKGRHRSFSEIYYLKSVTEAAGRTVTGTTNRHRLRNPRWGRISVKYFKGRFGLFLL